jgi:hypothetical protein
MWQVQLEAFNKAKCGRARVACPRCNASHPEGKCCEGRGIWNTNHTSGVGRPYKKGSNSIPPPRLTLRGFTVHIRHIPNLWPLYSMLNDGNTRSLTVSILRWRGD